MSQEYGGRADLSYQDAKSDKVYNISLERGGNAWIVRAAYGRRGKALTNLMKTDGVVPWNVAKATFDDLVAEKRRRGYTGQVEYDLQAVSTIPSRHQMLQYERPTDTLRTLGDP